MSRVYCFAVAVVLSALTIGCGFGSSARSDEELKKIAGGQLKEVVPVSGKVTVDSAPQPGVNVYLHPADGKPHTQFARSAADGTFCFASYRQCDGIEPGEYVLTFKYMPKMTPRGGGDDLFKDRYADAKKSEYKLSVEKGKPQKSLQFDLTTK